MFRVSLVILAAAGCICVLVLLAVQVKYLYPESCQQLGDASSCIQAEAFAAVLTD